MNIDVTIGIDPEDSRRYCGVHNVSHINKENVLHFVEWNAVRKFINKYEELPDAELLKKWPQRFYVMLGLAAKQMQCGVVPQYLVRYFDDKRRDLLSLRDSIFKEVCERYEVSARRPEDADLYDIP